METNSGQPNGKRRSPRAFSRHYWDDPRVQAASAAENRLYNHYNLDSTDSVIPVSELDVHLRVVEVGEQGDPPVLAIPGGIGSGIGWIPLLPELDGFRMLVMDRPGGGFSDGIDHRLTDTGTAAVKTLGAVVDSLDVDAVPIIANSVGGLWALRFAIERPERVSAVALAGCPFLYPGTSVPVGMRLGSLPLAGGLVIKRILRATDADGARKAWMALGHSEETVSSLPEEFAEAWYRMDNLPQSKQTWGNLLQSTVRLRGPRADAVLSKQDLREVESPVMLQWGSNDPFGTLEQGRQGAEHFPTADFHELGDGNLPWLDEPADGGQLLREFLSRHR